MSRVRLAVLELTTALHNWRTEPSPENVQRVVCAAAAGTHRKAHEAGRHLAFVDVSGASFRALLEPGATDVHLRTDHRSGAR